MKLCIHGIEKYCIHCWKKDQKKTETYDGYKTKKEFMNDKLALATTNN